ncbi:hypothetical protein SLS60_005748 [Paraconiothyrium brasiliense]|uniref:U1-type domain-containing protein n=1 Tax=Paraconiothyrium brasiliense TaxID=300254 RepID=A0ABR3RD30_9PLEO
MATQLWHGALAAGQFVAEYPMPAAYAYAAFVGSLAVPHYFPNITTVRTTIDPYPINATDINNLLNEIQRENILTQDTTIVKILWEKLETSGNKRLPRNVADCENLSRQIDYVLSTNGFDSKFLRHINCTARYEGYQPPARVRVPDIDFLPPGVKIWLKSGSGPSPEAVSKRRPSLTTIKSATATATEYYVGTGSEPAWAEGPRTTSAEADISCYLPKCLTVTSTRWAIETKTVILIDGNPPSGLVETPIATTNETGVKPASSDKSNSSGSVTSDVTSDSSGSSTSTPSSESTDRPQPPPTDPVPPPTDPVPPPTDPVSPPTDPVPPPTDPVPPPTDPVPPPTDPSPPPEEPSPPTSVTLSGLWSYFWAQASRPFLQIIYYSKLTTNSEYVDYVIRKDLDRLTGGHYEEIIENDVAWMVFKAISIIPWVSHETRAKWCRNGMAQIFAPDLFVDACTHVDKNLSRAAFKHALLELPKTKRNWQVWKDWLATPSRKARAVPAFITASWRNFLNNNPRGDDLKAAWEVLCYYGDHLSAAWEVLCYFGRKVSWWTSGILVYPRFADAIARSVLIIAATVIVHGFPLVYAQLQTHTTLAWMALCAFIAWCIRVLYVNLGGFGSLDIACLGIGCVASEIIHRFTRPKFNSPRRLRQFIFQYIDSLRRKLLGRLGIEVVTVLAYVHFFLAPSEGCPDPRLRLPLFCILSSTTAYHLTRLYVAMDPWRIPVRHDQELHKAVWDRFRAVNGNIRLSPLGWPLGWLIFASAMWVPLNGCLDWKIMIFAAYVGARIGYSLPPPPNNEVPVHVQIQDRPLAYARELYHELQLIQLSSVGHHYIPWIWWSLIMFGSTLRFLLSAAYAYSFHGGEEQCSPINPDRWPGIAILASVPTLLFILRLYFRDIPEKRALEGPLQYCFWLGLTASFGVYSIWSIGWTGCDLDAPVAAITVLLWSLVRWRFGVIGSFWDELPTIPPTIRGQRKAKGKQTGAPGYISNTLDANDGFSTELADAAFGLGTINTRTPPVTSHGPVMLQDGSQASLYSAPLSTSAQPTNVIIQEGRSRPGLRQRFDAATLVTLDVTPGQSVTIPGHPHIKVTYRGSGSGDNGSVGGVGRGGDRRMGKRPTVPDEYEGPGGEGEPDDGPSDPTIPRTPPSPSPPLSGGEDNGEDESDGSNDGTDDGAAEELALEQEASQSSSSHENSDLYDPPTPPPRSPRGPHSGVSDSYPKGPEAQPPSITPPQKTSTSPGTTAQDSQSDTSLASAGQSFPDEIEEEPSESEDDRNEYLPSNPNLEMPKVPKRQFIADRDRDSQPAEAGSEVSASRSIDHTAGTKGESTSGTNDKDATNEASEGEGPSEQESSADRGIESDDGKSGTVARVFDKNQSSTSGGNKVETKKPIVTQSKDERDPSVTDSKNGTKDKRPEGTEASKESESGASPQQRIALPIPRLGTALTPVFAQSHNPFRSDYMRELRDVDNQRYWWCDLCNFIAKVGNDEWLHHTLTKEHLKRSVQEKIEEADLQFKLSKEQPTKQGDKPEGITFSMLSYAKGPAYEIPTYKIPAYEIDPALFNQFLLKTKTTDIRRAKKYLHLAHGNLDDAVALFFDQPEYHFMTPQRLGRRRHRETMRAQERKQVEERSREIEEGRRYCMACQEKVSSEVFQDHLHSAEHRKQEDKYHSWKYCPICDMFYGSWDSHSGYDRHRRLKPKSTNVIIDDKERGWLWCSTCNARFGPGYPKDGDSPEDHYRRHTHWRAEEAEARGLQQPRHYQYCWDCGYGVTVQNYPEHVRSEEHIRKTVQRGGGGPYGGGGSYGGGGGGIEDDKIVVDENMADENTAEAHVPGDFAYDSDTEGVSSYAVYQPPVPSVQHSEPNTENPAANADNDGPQPQPAIATALPQSGNAPATSIPVLREGLSLNLPNDPQPHQHFKQEAAQKATSSGGSAEDTPKNTPTSSPSNANDHKEDGLPALKVSPKLDIDKAPASGRVLPVKAKEASSSRPDATDLDEEVKPVSTAEDRRHQRGAPVKQSPTPIEEKQIDHLGQPPSDGAQGNHDDKEAATGSETATPVKEGGDLKEETETSRRNDKQHKRSKSHGKHHDKNVDKDDQNQMAVKGESSANDSGASNQGHENSAPAATPSQDVPPNQHPKPTTDENYVETQAKHPNGDNSPPSDATAKDVSTSPVDGRRPDQRTRIKEKERQEAEAKKLELESANQVSFGAGERAPDGDTASAGTEAAREKPNQHRGGQKGKHNKDIYREKHGMPPFKNEALPAEPPGTPKGAEGSQRSIENESRAVSGDEHDIIVGSSARNSAADGGRGAEVSQAEEKRKNRRGRKPSKRENFETDEEFEQYQREREEKSKQQAALRERAEARKQQAALEEAENADKQPADGAQPVAGPSQTNADEQEQGDRAAGSSPPPLGSDPPAGGDDQEKHGNLEGVRQSGNDEPKKNGPKKRNKRGGKKRNKAKV